MTALPKRAAELREQGRRRRLRPRLRSEDYVRKAGDEEDWKKKTRDRGGWKRLSDEAVKKLRAAPHPCTKEKEEEREALVPVCAQIYVCFYATIDQKGLSSCEILITVMCIMSNNTNTSYEHICLYMKLKQVVAIPSGGSRSTVQIDIPVAVVE